MYINYLFIQEVREYNGEYEETNSECAEKYNEQERP